MRNWSMDELSCPRSQDPRDFTQDRVFVKRLVVHLVLIFRLGLRSFLSKKAQSRCIVNPSVGKAKMRFWLDQKASCRNEKHGGDEDEVVEMRQKWFLVKSRGQGTRRHWLLSRSRDRKSVV